MAKIRNLLLVFMLVLCLSSCGRNTNSDAGSSRPVITVGSEDYPPFIDLDNNGDPTGLDMDILKEAFDRVGYDIRFVAINWEDKDDLLASGEVDCVTGGFTVEGREEGYLWIGPYMNSNQVQVVNSGSDIRSLQDLEGKTVAVQAASVAESVLLELSNPGVQVLSFEDNMLPFAALASNYVDALVADEPVVVRYMKDYDTGFTILDEPVLYASVGTAFAKDGDAELCAKVNAAIDDMREDGTLQEIVEGYLDADGGESLEK